MFVKELEILFKDVMTSSNRVFTPSSTQWMSLGDDDGLVYRPTIDLEEGSRDSEEDLVGLSTGGSVGVTANVEGITLTTNTPPTASSVLESSRKRKRVEGSEKAKKKKRPTSRVIADVVSKIAVTSKDRADTLKKMSMNDAQVSDVVVELLTIPEVINDKDYMMMHQIARNMFLDVKGNKPTLLKWLRHHTYNSLHLQIALN